jgi:hypothetical protein
MCLGMVYELSSFVRSCLRFINLELGTMCVQSEKSIWWQSIVCCMLLPLIKNENEKVHTFRRPARIAVRTSLLEIRVSNFCKKTHVVFNNQPAVQKKVCNESKSSYYLWEITVAFPGCISKDLPYSTTTSVAGPISNGAHPWFWHWLALNECTKKNRQTAKQRLCMEHKLDMSRPHTDAAHNSLGGIGSWALAGASCNSEPLF